jgi:acetyl-CoA carboxylase biotin carboxyl carrier protein
MPSSEAETIQLALREVKDLVRALEGTTNSRVKIQAGAVQIEIERSAGATIMAATSATTATSVVASGTMPVVAPLVGVFYRAPSQGSKPFVEVGDTVERGQQVGIVEAMKVMNEVVTDYAGTVVEILVENGTAVAYEQKLMSIALVGTA